MALLGPSKAKAEYQGLLQQAIAQMKQRHEVFTDLNQRPPVLSEVPEEAPDDQVASLLVGVEEAKNRAKWWHYLGELVTAELGTLDRMDWILANTKVFISDGLGVSLGVQRQQSYQCLVIAGVEEETIIATLLGMSYPAWLKRSPDERLTLRSQVGL